MTFGLLSTVVYDERFELVGTVPLLILDDLGTESATPWAREKLYQIINYRYNERMATIDYLQLEARGDRAADLLTAV